MKIQDGDVLCIFGTAYTVRQTEVGGASEFLDRRVRDKIKKQFLSLAKDFIRTMPQELRPKKLVIRDTRSRWGSCSSSGTISICWRLAFAPLEVFRYVVVHECCHIEQMNHSAKFWALVGQHFGPGYESAKEWLRKHGQTLLIK